MPALFGTARPTQVPRGACPERSRRARDDGTSIPRVDLVLLELALQRVAGHAEAAGGLADAACGVLQRALDELLVDGRQHFFVDVAADIELGDEGIEPGGGHRHAA